MDYMLAPWLRYQGGFVINSYLKDAIRNKGYYIDIKHLFLIHWAAN